MTNETAVIQRLDALMFLSPEDTATLTGYARPCHQRAWLDKNGWQYVVNANGRPIVSRAYAESRLGIASATQAPTPDFSIFQKAA